MRDFLLGYEGPLRAYSEHDQDIVDQAILLWNVAPSIHPPSSTIRAHGLRP